MNTVDDEKAGTGPQLLDDLVLRAHAAESLLQLINIRNDCGEDSTEPPTWPQYLYRSVVLWEEVRNV